MQDRAAVPLTHVRPPVPLALRRVHVDEVLPRPHRQPLSVSAVLHVADLALASLQRGEQRQGRVFSQQVHQHRPALQPYRQLATLRVLEGKRSAAHACALLLQVGEAAGRGRGGEVKGGDKR
eukprot:725640-Hanusia_phi.AAC.1